MLSQLLPSCSSEKQFRALNLDITCPPSLPTVTSCYCLTKNKDGELLSKLSGKIDYQVNIISYIERGLTVRRKG